MDLQRTDIKEPPRETPIRILVCVWWLSTIVIVNIYLGILFAQLVVPRQPRSIETLEELVGQDEVKWCVTRGSALDELFRRSKPETIYGQLASRMLTVSSADEGVQRVKSSGWAFIRERSMLEFKVSSFLGAGSPNEVGIGDKNADPLSPGGYRNQRFEFKIAQEHNRMKACRFQLAKRADFFSVGFGLALTKGSPYLGAFNSALTLLIEQGFLSRWQSMYWPIRNRFTECKLQPLREGEPLSMKHFISIYLICSLVIGCSAALLLYQGCHEHLLGPSWLAAKW